MTTPAAAALYLAQHRLAVEGHGWAVVNPNDRPIDGLPIIYGFNNGGSPGLLSAVLIAADGTVLGRHGCSAEGYMEHDLGILEGSRPDRHETFAEHYPDGYKMEFVPSSAFDYETGSWAVPSLERALKLNKQRAECAKLGK